MLLAMEALSAFQVLVNTLSEKSKAEISTMYPCGKIHFIHIPYSAKRWRWKTLANRSEFAKVLPTNVLPSITPIMYVY